MNSVATTSETWHEKATFCRFCATPFSNDISPDISVNKWFSSYAEVDEDLLKETFNVQLSKHMSTSKLICAECGRRLHDAHSFKMLVINSEQRLLEDYQGKVEQEESSVLEDGYRAESDEIKVEPLPLEETYTYTVQDVVDGQGQDQMEMHHDDDDDDEILANMKSEEPPKVKRNKLKNPTIKLNIETSEKLILELRGTGPLLRENSLKLISNSTLCVFQWNKSRYRCFCCKEPYSDMNLLRQHMKIHTLKDIERIIITQQNNLVKVEVSVLTCKICNLEIENLTALKSHLKNHGVRFSVSTQDDLLVPYKIDKVLICQICTETFTVFRHLIMHMNKHFQTQVCHICGAGFSNRKFLNLHKYHSHSFKCKICDLTFSNRIEKREHDFQTHKLKTTKLRYPCPYCTERFKEENLRVIHLVEKHKFEKPEHKCNVCSKTFLTKSLCNNHIRGVHKKEKNHQCEVCNHLFYTKSDLLRHEVTHTGEKKFSCDICNTMFATKDSLRRHSKRAHV